MKRDAGAGRRGAIRRLAVGLLLLAGLTAAGSAGQAPPAPPVGSDGKEALLRFRAAESGRLRPLDAPAPPEHYPPADPDPPIDVEHYDIFLALSPADSLVEGVTTITGHLLRPVDSVTFDYCGPRVGTVALDGDAGAGATWDGAEIRVPLGSTRPAGERFVVTIAHGGVSARGLYFPDRNHPDSPAIFSFSEPEDARRWFPCRDRPQDKATLDLQVTVPGGYVVGSSGVLLRDEPRPDGRRLFHWRERSPIATYLISVVAGPYAILRDEGPAGLPLVHYVYPADSAAARVTFAPVPEMIDFFSGIFGPWPFSKYGHAEAFFPGGMEHQSLTLVGEFVVRRGPQYEWLVAHELGHQWWGDDVTPADWRHVWLNEGFASYSDALWFEHREGPAGLRRRMDLFSDLFKLGYLQNGIELPVLDPPADHLFSFSVYDKGAWVLHMLRHVVGDREFFDILRAWEARYRHGVADTDDFIAVCEEIHGVDLHWFFDPWLHDPGLARFVYDWSVAPADGGRQEVTITVRQKQAGAFFPMPVDFALIDSTGITRRRAFLDRNPQSVRFLVERAPVDTGVVIDPDGWILKTVERGSLEPVLRLSGFLAAAGPTSGPVEFRVRLSAGEPLPGELSIFDVRGRRVHRAPRTLLNPGENSLTWSGRDDAGRRVASGVYLAVLTGGGERRTARVVLAR